jgi:hypothetical protein
MAKQKSREVERPRLRLIVPVREVRGQPAPYLGPPKVGISAETAAVEGRAIEAIFRNTIKRALNDGSLAAELDRLGYDLVKRPRRKKRTQ